MMHCVAPERVANVRNRVLIEWLVSGNFCVKIIHCVVQVLYILNILIPANILL